jgi:hypothetical protein
MPLLMQLMQICEVHALGGSNSIQEYDMAAASNSTSPPGEIDLVIVVISDTFATNNTYKGKHLSQACCVMCPNPPSCIAE